LLQKEFPTLKSFKLPSYNIKYAKKGFFFRIKILLQIPFIISAISKEKIVVKKLIEKENINGIISDNRIGVLSKKIPSVYITHQLNVLSGLTTYISSKIHQKFIHQFDECWVPDLENEPNFSGKLGHLKTQHSKVKYIGILSRFKKQQLPVKYDLMVVLSGPEPQRTLLENKLLMELKRYKGMVLFVRGVLLNKARIEAPSNFEIKDYLLSKELEKALNQSNVIISRSGYTTVMDLAALGKKAFFIPTPGQLEQEYLAKKLHKNLIAPFAIQDRFTANNLNELKNFSGFEACKTTFDLNFFKLFKSE